MGELVWQIKEIKMRTLLFLLAVSTLGAQAPEPIKDKDKVEIQTITIQIMRIENTFRILQEEHTKLRAQRIKWHKDIITNYKADGYELDAELNWVKKDPALKLKEN